MSVRNRVRPVLRLAGWPALLLLVFAALWAVGNPPSPSASASAPC